MSWRASVPYRGQAWPCRWRVTARTSRVTGRVSLVHCRVVAPPVTIQKLYRDPNPTADTASRVARTLGRIGGRVAARYCLVAALYRRPAALYCDKTVAPGHDTNFISRLTPGQAMRARSPLTPARRPAMLWGRVARPLCHVVALCCTPQRLVSRYNPLYRDSDWKMGSSPSSLLQKKFFFHSLFFFSFCSTYWKTTIFFFFFFMSSV